MVEEELKDVGLTVSPLYAGLLIVFVSLLFLPVILIRQFNKIKILGFVIMALNSMITIYAVVFNTV
jgi:hypothetical protein